MAASLRSLSLATMFIYWHLADNRLHGITKEARGSDQRIKECLTVSLQGLEARLRSAPSMTEDGHRCVDGLNNRGHTHINVGFCPIHM